MLVGQTLVQGASKQKRQRLTSVSAASLLSKGGCKSVKFSLYCSGVNLLFLIAILVMNND
jgi:hypothetical protein